MVSVGLPEPGRDEQDDDVLADFPGNGEAFLGMGAITLAQIVSFFFSTTIWGRYTPAGQADFSPTRLRL